MAATRWVIICVAGFVLSGCGSSGGPGTAADGGPPITQIVQVTNLNDDGPGSLRQVVADALPGALVTFDPAIQGGSVFLMSQIEIEKSIRITGGPDGVQTELFLDNGDRAFFIDGAPFVRLEGLWLNDCEAPGTGGAMHVGNSSVVLSRVRITNAIAGLSGGAIQAAASELHLDRCDVAGCNAQHGGGLYLLLCETLITNSSLRVNAATNGPGGGVVMLGGSLTARSTTVHGNTALGGTPNDDGGGIVAIAMVSGGELGLFGCTITGNSAAEVGGGVMLGTEGGEGTFTVRQTIIADNNCPLRPDFAPSIVWATNASYNLIGSLDVGAIVDGVNGNMVGDSGAPLGPLLGPLQQVGDTYSRSPLLGSPANNAVPHAQCLDENGLPLFLDQRSVSRFGDGNADVGAVEFSP